MKSKFIKLVSLFSALILVFSLAACGEKDDNTSTTSATDANVGSVVVTEQNEATEEVSEIEDEETVTLDGETTKTDGTTKKDKENKVTTQKDKGKETTEKETTKKPTTTVSTTKKESESAPVDGSIAEIVAFYNKAANDTKAKKNFTYTRKELTKVIIDDISTKSGSLELLTKIGNGIIDRLTGGGKTVSAKEVFVNGKPTIGDLPLNTCMPIMESDIMSTLTAKGVKSATCKKDGDGYVVTIVLKPEKGTMQKAPPVHASCVNYLRLEALDLGPLNDNIKHAEMNYIDSTNSGTKFVAKVNKNNLLDYMNTYMTINGSGTGTLLGITATAKLHGTYESEYKYFW